MKQRLPNQIHLISINLLQFILLYLISEVFSDPLPYYFRVSYFSGSPDGVYKDRILGVNGKFPGPTIERNVGDRLTVFVVNDIHDAYENSTTMHWHGMLHQEGTIFQDGPSMITQCSLKMGQSQRYSFPLLSPGSGTYWYHSHVKSQYTEGLWGPLIIRSQPQLYACDDEIVITLSDWYHRSGRENEEWYLSPQSKGLPPYPDSILLNGYGRYNCEYARLQGRICDPAKQFRPVFKVLKNKKYRVRVINTSAWMTFNFSMDGHKLRAIEMDGSRLLKSDPVDSATLGPAQRYSFIIETELPMARYLIRSKLAKDLLFLRNLEVNINRYPNAVFEEVTGVLLYSTSAPERTGRLNDALPDLERFDYTQAIPPPTIRPSDIVYFDDFLLKPYFQESEPAVVNKAFVLDLGFAPDAQGVVRGSFNKVPFRLPDLKPLLLTYLQNEPFPASARPLMLDQHDVVQVVINNPGQGSHPIHLHGHHFWMTARGTGKYDPIRNQNSRLVLDGGRRDTVMVHQNSWLAIRFRADNPGTWTFHCHIDWHLLSGMSATFVTESEEGRKILWRNMPPEFREVCAAHGLFF